MLLNERAAKISVAICILSNKNRDNIFKVNLANVNKTNCLVSISTVWQMILFSLFYFEIATIDPSDQLDPI